MTRTPGRETIAALEAAGFVRESTGYWTRGAKPHVRNESKFWVDAHMSSEHNTRVMNHLKGLRQ